MVKVYKKILLLVWYWFKVSFHRIKEKEKVMDIKVSMQILAGVCGVVLLMLLLKQKMQVFLEFLLRLGVGTVTILWMNHILLKQGIRWSVGINFWSLLTSGILGIPGVLLLFVILALQNL